VLELTLLRLDEAEVSDQEVHEFARAEMKKRDIAGAVDGQVRPKVAKATADARYKAQMDNPITMESDCRRDGEQVANAATSDPCAPSE